MKTLALFNGDLMLGKGGYVLFDGTDRIRQDLTLALREEYGSDRFHPGYGSIIMRYIGNVITPQLETLVRAEINRVVQNYVAIQQAEVIRDTTVDVKGRFKTSDVVRAILGIASRIDTDRIDVSISLETLARTTITIRKSLVNS